MTVHLTGEATIDLAGAYVEVEQVCDLSRGACWRPFAPADDAEPTLEVDTERGARVSLRGLPPAAIDAIVEAWRAASAETPERIAMAERTAGGALEGGR